MSPGLGTGLVAALAAAALSFGASGAAASTEIGSHCVGDTSGGNATRVQVANDPTDPLPAAAPASGVITSWSVNVAPPGFALPEKLKVMRPTASANQFTTVAESDFEAVLGQSSFETRIPIQAGDRLGLYASDSTGALICSVTGKDAEVVGSAAGDTAIGSTRSFLTAEETQLPVAAKIEPDADGDGYGDETQDRCPQGAATQAPCPTITLDTFPVVLKRSVLVLVSASETSSVQVFGQVGWKPRHKGGALATKTPGKPGDHVSTGVIVGLRGGTTLVKPGEVTPFNVKLPKSVLRHLGDISPKQVVKGTITARTTDLAGRVTDHTITIRLHGRKARAS